MTSPADVTVPGLFLAVLAIAIREALALFSRRSKSDEYAVLSKKIDALNDQVAILVRAEAKENIERLVDAKIAAARKKQ